MGVAQGTTVTSSTRARSGSSAARPRRPRALAERLRRRLRAIRPPLDYRGRRRRLRRGGRLRGDRERGGGRAGAERARRRGRGLRDRLDRHGGRRLRGVRDQHRYPVDLRGARTRRVDRRGRLGVKGRSRSAGSRTIGAASRPREPSDVGEAGNRGRVADRAAVAAAAYRTRTGRSVARTSACCVGRR